MTNGKTVYILLVNLLIPSTLRFIVSKVEKQHSVNAESRNLFVRIFFLTFFNTAVVLLLENYNFNPSQVGENNDYLFNMVPIPKGKYTDFTEEWLKLVEAHLTAKLPVLKQHTPPNEPCCSLFYSFIITQAGWNECLRFYI